MNFPFLALNPYNSVRVNYGSKEDEYFVNTPLDIVVDLDKEGKGQITIMNRVVFVTADPAVGVTTLTLNNINGDPALVDNPQVTQVTTNL